MKGTIVTVIILVIVVGGFFFFRSDTSDLVEGSQLEFFLENLEELASGHYEGWAIFGDEKVSTGKFSVGDSLVFTSSRDLSTADMIVVTIEAEGDTDDEPSGVVVLAGSLVDGSADLSFPLDLSGAAGSYILATPTDGPDSNETSGVWFLKLPEPFTAGLTLPELTDGWVYEGWAVHQGVPLSTGRFTSVDGSDLFDGFSGTESGPPFPGEDFLQSAPEGMTFPIDLADGSSVIVVSVEPDLNGVDPTGDGPFQVKPLVGEVVVGAADFTNYDLVLDLGTVPVGTAQVR